MFWQLRTGGTDRATRNQRKYRMKKLEDLGLEKTVKEGVGKYRKNQESLVAETTGRVCPRRSSGPLCHMLGMKHLLEAEK